ncbi:hypothetical protein MPSEU_000591800 [Mayamaea pseudoterrestris]|nr:hypothetical protein MPSEU_000591800 [Mayamaea pseudoterrestris]
MPPNRRAVSCPDLFALDEPSHHWFATAAEASGSKGFSSQEQDESSNDALVNYWDWHLDDEQLRMEEERLEVAEHRGAINIAGRSSHHLAKQRVMVDLATGNAEDAHHHPHYWTWVHWVEKETEASQDFAHSFWEWRDETEHHHAIKHVYRSNNFRRAVENDNAMETNSDHGVDYWHGF